MDPALAERAHELTAHGCAVPNPLAAITARERAIVGLAAQGVRNREIADQLGITEGTVKVYLHRIYEKLGVSNRTELALLARSVR
jgi:two-component system nitrate/nitrite response regulator NarP